MENNYRQDVDSGFDKKRIIETCAINCLKRGIPLEILTKSKAFNYNHLEMIKNLKKGYERKVDFVVAQYELYGVDLFDFELADNFSRVHHPVGGELYPMTREEEIEKFTLRDKYVSEINSLREANLEEYDSICEKYKNELVDFKLEYPIINNILDCVDDIESLESELKRNLTLEEISKLYIKSGLETKNMEFYNNLYSEYKKREKKLEDSVSAYNNLYSGKIKLNDLVLKKNMLEEEILKRNVKLVNGFIRQKYTDLLVETEDLFQECYFAVGRALKDYDVTLGFKFSSFAYKYMDCQVKRNFVRLTGIKWEHYWLKRYLETQIEIMSLEFNHNVTIEELDEWGMLPVSLKMAKCILNISYCLPGYGYDKKIDSVVEKEYDAEDEGSYEILDESYIYYPEKILDDIEHSMLAEAIEEMLNTITPREADIIRMRFGLDDGQKKTQLYVAKAFKVSPSRIAQIEAKALRKLRHPSRSKKIKEFF